MPIQHHAWLELARTGTHAGNAFVICLMALAQATLLVEHHDRPRFNTAGNVEIFGKVGIPQHDVTGDFYIAFKKAGEPPALPVNTHPDFAFAEYAIATFAGSMEFIEGIEWYS